MAIKKTEEQIVAENVVFGVALLFIGCWVLWSVGVAFVAAGGVLVLTQVPAVVVEALRWLRRA